MDHVCFSREDILNELDRRAELGEFPMLDNGHVYLADTRLSAYGDDSRWAIVIEVLGVNNTIGTHYSIHNALYCFGNCLIHSLVTKPENVLHPTADSSEDPTFQADYEIYVRPEARTLRIRGHAVPITTDPSVLEARGIILVEPPAVTVIDLLRSLLPAYRDALLATDDELRQHVPADLPLLLRLDTWNHPDIASGEKPSDSEAFQLLSEVLVTGNTSLYSPSLAPNTEWVYWPDAGSL